MILLHPNTESEIKCIQSKILASLSFNHRLDTVVVGGGVFCQPQTEMFIIIRNQILEFSSSHLALGSALLIIALTPSWEVAASGSDGKYLVHRHSTPCQVSSENAPLLSSSSLSLLPSSSWPYCIKVPSFVGKCTFVVLVVVALMHQLPLKILFRI